MVKKEQSLTKEQLELKRDQFIKQQEKVVKLIDEYSTLYTKLSGAIETITILLGSFEEPKVEEVIKDENPKLVKEK